jgi:tRNA dimethylallyltransferase
MKIKIYAIVGSTASGKSSLAMALAESMGGEIISCDSMQVYKRMNTGTAKPTAEEQSRVKHHMIDINEPWESFSCADYVSLADSAIRDCHGRGKLPIVCGGTGLYLDALLRGADFGEENGNAELRQELLDFAEKNGAEALHRELQRIDPESAEKTHPNNVKRVARAIEIYKLSGVTKTELDRRSQLEEPRFDAKVIGLHYDDREVLYSRIDKRVDAMIAEGLCEETAELEKEGIFERNSTAAQAIGYKELLPYVREEDNLENCVDELKRATRRYAKRQITRFGGKKYVESLPVMENGRIKTFEEIVNNAKELFFN